MYYKTPSVFLIKYLQMEAIHIASTPAELYNAVLVDTPLAPFFQSCINEQVRSCY